MYQESWICDKCGNQHIVDTDITAYRTPKSSLPDKWQMVIFDPSIKVEGRNKTIPIEIKNMVFCENCKQEVLPHILENIELMP